MNDIPFDFDPTTGKATVRNIDHFPREIFDMAEQIKILDMSTIPLTSLPEDLNKLVNMQVAFFSNNKNLEMMPEVLGKCERLETIGMRSCNIRQISEHSLPTSLRALILTDNHITELPHSIGKCVNLQKIMIAGNRLRSLPHELLECQNLEIVRFAVNDLSTPVDWLFQLPQLAWYGDASNPFSLHIDQSQDHKIAWYDVVVGNEIGRSTNNIVYRARLPDGKEVAIKLYGHALVTDGLPADDMDASLCIGESQNLVGSIGKLTGAPNDQQALIMPLIPQSFKNLSKPPTLKSVCRDTYPEGQVFTLSFIRRVALSVASGMRHLHSKGIMHGDLYAHNILTNTVGESRVGDFGAASLYKIGSDSGRLRELIDVRAFGVLLDELLSRRVSPSKNTRATARLQQLTDDCLDRITTNRPSFAEIIETLAT